MMLDSSSKPYSSNTLLRSCYQILPSSWTLCRINGSFANEFTEVILLRQGETYDLQKFLMFSSPTILETYRTNSAPRSQTACLFSSFTTAIGVAEGTSSPTTSQSTFSHWRQLERVQMYLENTLLGVGKRGLSSGRFSPTVPTCAISMENSSSLLKCR